ncbi:MAG: pilus assembly PilX N-terminal domain-containing protein [candidate division Zixibacteria bacterium]|nr:pilus assembly PilX N-terminal domain-containing protein [candidate division Zixibacteria bacterium]
MIKYINKERGSALLLALVIMVMLTFIFIAALTTSVTDMDISKNMKERTSAFYLAEAGLEIGMGVLKNNPNMLNNDSLEMLVNANPNLGNGNFSMDVTGTAPYKTLTSSGNSKEGISQVQVMVKRKKNPYNIWNNIVFAGVGQSGRTIAGNISFHGPVHILGEGEPFTDSNGNGNWDPADTYTDLNGNGVWNPGEPLLTDSDGDGVWDTTEPYTDSNGNGAYDAALSAVDLAYEAVGTARIYNNYSGITSDLSTRIPPLDTTTFNGEVVNTLDAELRVKHGQVSVSGSATVGQPNASGNSVKETMDGCYVNDGYTGNKGASQVYSDNGTNQGYDLEGNFSFPNLSNSYTDPNTGYTYSSYLNYLNSNALVISGDLNLQPGVPYPAQSNANGSIYLDNNGNLQISGMVYVTGNINMNAGSGGLKSTPILFDGRGTLVSANDINISTHVLSQGMFPANDVIGFIAAKDLNIGTGSGDSQLKIMGAFYAQGKITNAKQNQIAGAMVSNYFSATNVPDVFHVPTLVDNLPPGMPGSGTAYVYTYQIVPNSWREL